MTVAPLHAWLVIIVHIKHSMSEIDCSYFYSMPSTRSLMQCKTLRRQVLNVMQWYKSILGRTYFRTHSTR